MKLRHILSLGLVACAPALAFAQATPTASAAALSGAPVTKNPCDKPDAFPGNLASEKQQRAWQKTMDAYGACTKKFADEQRAIAESAIKAGNDAVSEYNAEVQKAKDEIEKAKESSQ
jgi:hypothetical protein